MIEREEGEGDDVGDDEFDADQNRSGRKPYGFFSNHGVFCVTEIVVRVTWCDLCLTCTTYPKIQRSKYPKIQRSKDPKIQMSDSALLHWSVYILGHCTCMSYSISYSSCDSPLLTAPGCAWSLHYGSLHSWIQTCYCSVVASLDCVPRFRILNRPSARRSAWTKSIDGCAWTWRSSRGSPTIAPWFPGATGRSAPYSTRCPFWTPSLACRSAPSPDACAPHVAIIISSPWSRPLTIRSWCCSASWCRWPWTGSPLAKPPN